MTPLTPILSRSTFKFKMSRFRCNFVTFQNVMNLMHILFEKLWRKLIIFQGRDRGGTTLWKIT